MESALRSAEDAMRRADTDPGRAIPYAQAAVAAARAQADHAAAAVAYRAWGHALMQCSDVDTAIRYLRASIRYATRARSAPLTGEARSKLAYALVMRGRPGDALAQIDLAMADLDEPAKARVSGQRAVILSEIGRLDDAVGAFDAALAGLRAADDRLSIARTLVNRGILHAHRHSFAAAEADLREAERISTALGRGLAIGIIAENLGYVQTLRGDVPAALSHLDRAERSLVAHGGQVAPVHYDRGLLWLSLGLTAEARQSAELAVRAFRREGRALKVPEARLLAAQAALAAGDRRTARAQATQAVREFDRQRRAEWSALAQVTAAQAGRRIDTATAAALADRLTAAGWPAAAVEAHLIAAGAAADDSALAHLSAGAGVRTGGPAILRARGWYAEALLRHRTGRDPIPAIRAGLRLLDEHAASLGAADLRAQSAVHRRDLTYLGLRLALHDKRAEHVFEWAERGKASRLAYRPVHPPPDPQLADLLAQLRTVGLKIAEAGGADGHLARQQAALERRVRDHTRRRTATARSALPVVEVHTLRDVLRSTTLVQYASANGILHAVVVTGSVTRLHRLCPVSRLNDLVHRVRFALHRMADHHTQPHSRAAARTLLHAAARELDSLLLQPLRLSDDLLVIVPTGPLHSIPWSVLPSCTGRPVAVCPSATLWHATATSPAGTTGGIVVAAGPGLPGAAAEAQQIATLYATTALVHADATVAATLSAMSSAGLAHLAGHGRLVPEHPLFSHLMLADGPLVAYDLEHLPRTPTTVVLAACDAGRSVVYTGDEVLGLGAAFVAHGTTQLIASVLPIPDAQTTPLMVGLHRRLIAKTAPAEALALAQRSVADEDDAVAAAAAGFVCLGAGLSGL
jgi:tetratricopeptide (TPR) repeat protein